MRKDLLIPSPMGIPPIQISREPLVGRDGSDRCHHRCHCWPQVALTQAQLEQVMRTAGPVLPELRDEYLRMVAQAWRAVQHAVDR